MFMNCTQNICAKFFRHVLHFILHFIFSSKNIEIPRKSYSVQF